MFKAVAGANWPFRRVVSQDFIRSPQIRQVFGSQTFAVLIAT
jgi:hypothetical protein